MKKFLLSTLVLLFGLLTIPSVSLASEDIQKASGWQTILNQSLYATSYWKNTSTATSGGGNLQLCVSGINPYNEVHVNLYSDDAGSDDRLVLPRYHFYNSGNTSEFCTTIYAEPYVDGAYAEFYVSAMADSGDNLQIVLRD